MKRFVFTVAAIASVTSLAGSAQAADGCWYGARAHAYDHAELAHRAQHRQEAHHAAHHTPMTYRQHSALHAELNHEAAHDRIQHRAAHQYGAYGRFGGGYYGGQRGGYGFYGDHGVTLRTPFGSVWLHH